VKFILLVGQKNSPSQPATPEYAAQYKKDPKHPYPDGFIAVADPNWVKTDKAIKKTSNAIPAHMVISAEDMELHYASSGNDFPWDAEVKLIKILKAKGLYP